ncbi:MAG TPA: methyltransferase domain-containing protein [bacterium]|nr:methyltransferase domain-containing protein [bacterium]
MQTRAGKGYVHGYEVREADRLRDQARTLAELLHADTRFPPGSAVLEAGCGVGAQTEALAAGSPGAYFVCFDRRGESLAQARRAAAGRIDASFLQGDIVNMPFAPGSFDHVFLCFVLEHLAEPAQALKKLRETLRPGGTITAIEGDHGSSLYHPRSAAAWATIQCLIDLQTRAGGDPLIGRRLFPLLRQAGFDPVAVSPRQVYADAGRPETVEGFTRRTFIAMVEGVREPALAAGLIDARRWEEGIEDLRRTAGPGGTFAYTFFKAVGRNPGPGGGEP